MFELIRVVHTVLLGCRPFYRTCGSVRWCVRHPHQDSDCIPSCSCENIRTDFECDSCGQREHCRPAESHTQADDFEISVLTVSSPDFYRKRDRALGVSFKETQRHDIVSFQTKCLLTGFSFRVETSTYVEGPGAAASSGFTDEAGLMEVEVWDEDFLLLPLRMDAVDIERRDTKRNPVGIRRRIILFLEEFKLSVTHTEGHEIEIQEEVLDSRDVLDEMRFLGRRSVLLKRPFFPKKFAR